MKTNDCAYNGLFAEMDINAIYKEYVFELPQTSDNTTAHESFVRYDDTDYDQRR